ncbi:uncharacterized protein Tco025E_06434 [Trypanosoma conorhini]|uniref:Uncharacterized protein n=1 Tax=Trypanosoma conorhini TaxID=83891 RepID=A0A422P4I9_9TRYP|nr:uncharacterized protein Tco025E_06434 [Trypanosoma conorhini]RNF12584.1 hypothetical protein Tco025E_06434 [Trypanosoma conorhini]
MSGAKDEVANKIREGTQRRFEEIQRLRQLRQERREELKEKAANAAPVSPASFIPFILISLVFLSFPLSEPKVDWLLVSLFVVLNGLWTILFRSRSWLNLATMILSNIALVRWSPIIPNLPQLIRGVSLKYVVAYVAGNILLVIIIYFAYVERRAPWCASGQQRGRKSVRNDKGNGEKSETLEEFARRRDRMNRLDLAASGVIVGNLLLLVLLGVVPLEIFMHSFRQLISFLR